MLAGLLKTNTTPPAKSDFKDVSAGDWFYDAVESAFQAGWVKGFGDGTFKPDAVLSRCAGDDCLGRVLFVATVAMIACSPFNLV